MSKNRRTQHGRARRTSKKQQGVSKRTKVVWTALALSMGCAVSVLAVAGGSNGPTLPTRAIPAAAAVSAPASLESAFTTDAPLDAERWRAIVIYHSGSPYGNAESIGRRHENLGLQGLGYHFVVGNGSGLPDGAVELGFRWLRQLPGAHATGPYADWYDQHAIGICLVGHGNRRPFTRAQMSRLISLVRVLARELDIPPERIYLHSDIASTDSPGWHFPEASFREQIASGR